MITKAYSCNTCKKLRQHIDMFNKDICYPCYDKLSKEAQDNLWVKK